MKSLINIGIRADYKELKIVDEFRELFPFGKQGAGFSVELPPDDPRVTAVLKTFEQRGIPKVDYSRKHNRPAVEYTLAYHRTYEPADFDDAQFLKLKHEVLVSDESERDEKGRLVLEAWHLMPALRMGCVLFNATVVGASLRQRMEAAELVGIEFRELVLTRSREHRTLADEQGKVFRHVTPEDNDHIKKQGQYWELTSSVLLPPMPPERVVRHFPDDNVHVAGIRDEDYFDKEIHYAEGAIHKLEPFDFALTHEIFGAENWKQFPGERWPIASQRFRKFCLAQNLKVSWIPVRIDAG